MVGARSKVGLALAAALVLGACGTDRELTRPDPQPVTAESVRSALLLATDLPDGFETAEEATPVNAEIVPEHECDDALTQLEPDEVSTVDYTRGDVTVSHAVAWFDGRGGAVDQLVRDIAEDCGSVVGEDGVAIRASGLDFGVLSDDTLAVQLELETAGEPITERDIILRRQGDLVSIIRVSGLRPTDRALIDTAVRVTLGRLGLLYNDVQGI